MPKPDSLPKNQSSHQSAYPYFNEAPVCYPSPGVRRISLFPEELLSSSAAPTMDYAALGFDDSNMPNGKQLLFDLNCVDGLKVGGTLASAIHLRRLLIREINRVYTKWIKNDVSDNLDYTERFCEVFDPFENQNTKQSYRSPIISNLRTGIINDPNETIESLNIGSEVSPVYTPKSSPISLKQVRRKSFATSADYFVNEGANALASNIGQRTIHTGFPANDKIKNLNTVSLSNKIFIPEHPTYNFIGRILGPRGNSVRRLEAMTECKILIRGKGSIKDPNRELELSKTAGWEHLKEPLHVQIVAEDVNESLCRAKLRRGSTTLKRLLTPQFDNYKRQQLITLAIINGSYKSRT